MELLTIQQAARLLNVSPITVRRYVRTGYLPALTVRGELRVRREMLERFVGSIAPPGPRSRPWAPTYGRPVTEDWLVGFVGMAGSKGDAPTDVSSNKYRYLAEADAPHALTEAASSKEE